MGGEVKIGYTDGQLASLLSTFLRNENESIFSLFYCLHHFPFQRAATWVVHAWRCSLSGLHAAGLDSIACAVTASRIA